MPCAFFHNLGATTQDRGLLGLHLEEVPGGKQPHWAKVIALDLFIGRLQEVPSPCAFLHIQPSLKDLQRDLFPNAEGT